jgi:thiol-disulfide isomerase/thioredoxin
MIVRAIVLVAACFCFVFAVIAAPVHTRVKSAPGAARPSQRIVVRELNLETLKQLINRNPAKPRPLLINFWATWCDPCRDEFPDLVKIHRAYRSKGLDFVTISLDDKTELKTGVPRFLQQMRATMPAYYLNEDDPEPAINYIDPRWSGALPATVLYDAQGKLIYKHFGRISVTELRSEIEKTLGK